MSDSQGYSPRVLLHISLSLPDPHLEGEGTPVLFCCRFVGHIVPKKGDKEQGRTPLTPDPSGGILKTGSFSNGPAFRQKKQQEKGVLV